MLGTPAAPIIETSRLRLRGWRIDDFQAYAELVAEPDTARFITRQRKPYSAAEAWAEIAFFIGHWQMLGYGMFVVEEREGATFVGRVGFLNPPGWPALEVAWALTQASRGNGYATEAASAAIEWAFETSPVDSVISVIHSDNVSSQRVAKRLCEEQTRKQFSPFGEPCDLWEITRQTWQARKRKGTLGYDRCE